MRDAIIKTGRPMLYSLCEWGEANVQTWGNQTAQSWRSTGDISGKLILFTSPLFSLQQTAEISLSFVV